MAVLNISSTGSSSTSSSQLARLTRLSSRPLTLSELFLIGPGGVKARSLLTSDTDHSASWHSVLMPLVNISAQLLWPRCAISTFQEFLLSACQHMQIQVNTRHVSSMIHSARLSLASSEHCFRLKFVLF